MRRECLNICSGNDLLRRIPCGSTYISVAAAGDGGGKKELQTVSPRPYVVSPLHLVFLFLQACIST